MYGEKFDSLKENNRHFILFTLITNLLKYIQSTNTVGMHLLYLQEYLDP